MEVLNSPRIPIASVTLTRQLKQEEATVAKVPTCYRSLQRLLLKELQLPKPSLQLLKNSGIYIEKLVRHKFKVFELKTIIQLLY
ncbi:MAG: hypothetical protein WKF59_11040 [Chitinophagaceae bacterium]